MPRNDVYFETGDLSKVVALGTYAVGLNAWDPNDYFAEFLSLLKTAAIKPIDARIFNLRMIDSANFFTKGKLEEVSKICSENIAEKLVISSSLTGMQKRNLERLLGIEVIDRTDLILLIFKNAAISAEGQLQVRIAEINIAKTRLAGIGHEMGQQQFGVGSRGPGETEKEFLTRAYSEEIIKAQKKLLSLQKTRDVQRKKRLRSGIALVALVGYTNAGKSTILNSLTNANVLAQDKLFATLDTTTKEFFISPKTKILLSDTVGFISELPHHLIQAFRSTLDELSFAHLILHVVDVSNSSWQEQIGVVEKTLDDLKLNQQRLYLLNKTDKLKPEIQNQIKQYFSEIAADFIFVSAITSDGLNDLRNLLKEKFEKPINENESQESYSDILEDEK